MKSSCLSSTNSRAETRPSTYRNWGASKALFLFGLMQEARRPLIVITADDDQAGILAQDGRLRQICPAAMQDSPHR